MTDLAFGVDAVHPFDLEAEDGAQKNLWLNDQMWARDQR